MALSASPRKVVPLATGDDWLSVAKPAPSGPSTVKRVFFCGVVVESTENGRRLPEDVEDLIASLGEPMSADSDSQLLSLSTDANSNDVSDRKAKATDSSTLLDLINELVVTERGYVRRLQILKHDYADPLRKFSRNKDTSILPPYEAKTLFGNIDQLLPVNEAFLADLERMLKPDGPRTVGGVGDVALRHFEEHRGFEFYKGYYDKREEAQTIFLREMGKKSSPFAAFIDRIKYANADSRNRIGLRELLMDPVQRIPRYTLLFRAMIKHMATADPQRRKLIEADKIASKIALAEADDQTKQAAIWYCLKATVDGFPAGLISHSRRFIDCIDVEDVILDSSSSISAGPSTSSSLHCTLFLFDDKLLIAKRPGNGEKSGRSLSGLDEMDKLAKSGGLPLGMKKSGMTFKGVMDITDVVAADVGGSDMHIYLEDPPQGQTDRWSGRPFRSLSVVHPPSPINFDPTRAQNDKSRFLEHLWEAQAKYRTKAGQSVVLCRDETETKVVVHIDPLGSADPVPFGMDGPPFVRIRVQPMAGELCRYIVMSNDPNDDSEEDIVQTARVPARIVQTIHQFGLFKFRTGNNSAPGTPTATLRSRAHIFGLDAISRNLFNGRPGSAKIDFFSGSINASRRSKSSVSKSSTTTMTGDGSLMKFSSRNSTTTAATSVLSMDEDAFFGSGGSGGGKSSSTRSRSRSITRKLLKKRSQSPGTFNSDSEGLSSKRHASRSNPGSRATSEERELEYSDMDDVNSMPPSRAMDESDMDLSMRLELARRNSESQHGKLPSPPVEPNVEETIYEEMPDFVSAKDEMLMEIDQPSTPPAEAEDIVIQHSGRRAPFAPAVDTTPKQPTNGMATPSIEPLSIKKKTSVNSNKSYGSPFPMRKTFTRTSPSSIGRIVSPRKVSPQVRTKRTSAQANEKSVDVENMMRLAETTREDMESSHRAVKRIKLGLDNFQTNSPQVLSEENWRSTSPVKGLPRTPVRTKEAQDRMNEMRSLIGRRLESEATPRTRAGTLHNASTPRNVEAVPADDIASSLQELVSEADQHILKASSNYEAMQDNIRLLANDLKQKSTNLDKARVELQNTKRQCELVKSLLADATAEKEIMYEAFNEELDGMYQDAQLPEDEAWTSMAEDLRKTKESRNALARENSQLKRRLAEMECQQEEWASLLRAHGLIS
ncbi:hypothetical protein HWV62_32792 [Athelia sp. TMB]|nr:hypothetical protein HWV62_32792 [Athelia sp. TMB]